MNFKRIKDMIDRNKTISLSQYPIEELDLMDYIEWYNPDGSLRISDSSDEKPWCPAAGKPKERYDSEEAAKKKARYNIKRFSIHPAWRAYFCKVCNCWHLSSKPQYDPNKRRK